MDPRELAFAGAVEQARMLADEVVTAPDLVEVYLERIARLNPTLRAYALVLADTARAEAVAAQHRLDAGERLALLGVPVAVKDDVDVAGQVTAYGTDAHGPAATADAEVVRRLRAAGAVILGKTAVPEMMMFPYAESLTFGSTVNPWDPSRTPGGSSGGSGAAVAAGLAALALGSDGAGSIRIPATWCGLFGLKPQRDRVPLAPHDDAWCGLSVNGPMTRSVPDAAVFLDATVADAGGRFAAAATCEPGRLRIALSTKVPPPFASPVGGAQRAAVGQAGDLLSELGHQVVQRDPDYPVGAALGFMPRYFRGIYDDVRTLPHPERLEARTRSMGRIGRLVSDRRIAAIRAGEAAVARRIQTIFDDVDVLIIPGNATGPQRVGAYQRRGGVSTLALTAARVPFHWIWNVTGQPAAVVPWDLDGDGLPLSIQLVGRPHDEATLLTLAAQIERARPWAQRRPPVS